MIQVTTDKGARFPALVSLLAAMGLLGLFHALFLVGRNLDYASPEMAWGMTRFGMVGAVATLLVLAPVALLLRRLLPAWRRGDRQRASWTAAFGLAAAVAAWTLADPWVATPLVPAALEPWVEAAAALAAGLAAGWVRPAWKWLRAGAVATVALVVASLLPIGGGGGRHPPPEASVSTAGGPDVVLVSIDTLRADRLGVYGRAPSITPQMDRVAAEGVVFRRALAAGPWTIPSVASMLTGLPTERHGAGRPRSAAMTFLRSPLPGDHTTLAERLTAAGYRTRAVVANGFLTADMGMDQGFQEFVNSMMTAMGGGFLRELPLGRIVTSLLPPTAFGDYRAAGVTDQALAWLAEDDERPLFLWVHYLGPHVPLQADPGALDIEALMAMMREKHPEVRDDGTVVGDVFFAPGRVRSGQLFLGPEDRRRITEYYDRTVAYTDEHVGRLFAALRERAAKRPVVAVLTADHGEELWDHGHYEHGHDYYREVTWVPLVFWGPGAVPAGETVDAVAGLVDVAPTLLALAGLTAPPPAAVDEGRPLTAVWSGAADAAAPPRFSGGNLYYLPAVLVEEGPWRFILRANGRQELYDVTRDPRERHNLAFDHPDVAERFRQALEPRLAYFLAGGEGTQEMSPEAMEALRALGYAQ